RFSIRYPENWTVNPSGKNMVIPKQLLQEQDIDKIKVLPLLVTINSDITPSTNWKEIALTNGQKAYYSFEDGFDHYYLVSGNLMLVQLSVPVRIYDGSMYTEQELKEAAQIINTFQAL